MLGFYQREIRDMALFVINYDLRNKRDYQPLYDEMVRLDAFKTLESVYLVELEHTASEVRDHFKEFIDDDDGLLVIEFQKRPAAFKCKPGTKKWIETHFG